MNVDEKVAIVKSVAAEILTEDDLRRLFTEKENPHAYDGFEPSGQIHVAQGILRAITINKLIKTGIHFTLWVADWFALMNNKMGGDIEKIRTLGEYYIEVWKASGMDLSCVNFVWASERMDQEYWLRTVRIGVANSVERIERCAQIMGRGDKESLSAAQIFYATMQCSDVFELDVDIIQMGLDQRKVNVLAREMADKFGWKKPVAIHHGMMMGLQPQLAQETTMILGESHNDVNKFYCEIDSEHRIIWHNSKPILFRGEINSENEFVILEKDPAWSIISVGEPQKAKIPFEDTFRTVVLRQKLTGAEAAIAKKMSKSKPDSAIYMTDSAEDVERKMNKAYCPEGIVENNPILEYFKSIIFEAQHLTNRAKSVVIIERPEKFGGNVSFSHYSELETAYTTKGPDGKFLIHPMDLKKTCAKELNSILEPVRTHFATDEKARALLEKVKSYEVTR